MTMNTNSVEEYGVRGTEYEERIQMDQGCSLTRSEMEELEGRRAPRH